MLWLLYFWRLEPEKWIDGIIEMIELFKKDKKKPAFEVFIFGSGSREKKIQELAAENENIHYFWRQDLKTIKRYIGNYQYALMPSECLESFGLSALNALQWGLAPIGYAKGGLKEFIDPKLDLTHQSGHTTGTRLYNLIRIIGKERTFKRLSVSSVDRFSKESRLMKFYTLAGKETKRVLIVSDFINRIGGIETYINDVKALLEQHGYEVELCGGKVPGWPLGKFAKYLGIITWLGNFRETIKLQRKIEKFKPDLIRYHSVMRYLGRAPIRASRNAKAKKRMMFHDLGYFSPFPSSLQQERQVKTPFTLNNFIRTQPTKNPITLLAIIGKYLSLKLIQRQLKARMDLFLVPSPFMVDIVHKSYKIDTDSIRIFFHFIQE